MDPDLNKYDLDHRTTGHAHMTPQEWDEAYKGAWASYYSWEHIETIMRRAAAGRATGRFKMNLTATATNLIWFKAAIEVDDVHPLEIGYFRLKYRRDRRPERGIEPVWRVYPKLIVETLAKQTKLALMVARMTLIYRRVARDPERHEHMDAALMPVTAAELETGELFRSEAARAYLGQERRLHDIRTGRGESVVQTKKPAEREAQALAG
jgi:hypothetical protein